MKTIYTVLLSICTSVALCNEDQEAQNSRFIALDQIKQKIVILSHKDKLDRLLQQRQITQEAYNNKTEELQNTKLFTDLEPLFNEITELSKNLIDNFE